MREIWLDEKFSAFRNLKKNKCTNCVSKEDYQEGCRLGIDIDLC